MKAPILLMLPSAHLLLLRSDRITRNAQSPADPAGLLFALRSCPRPPRTLADWRTLRLLCFAKCLIFQGFMAPAVGIEPTTN